MLTKTSDLKTVVGVVQVIPVNTVALAVLSNNLNLIRYENEAFFIRHCRDAHAILYG